MAFGALKSQWQHPIGFLEVLLILRRHTNGCCSTIRGSFPLHSCTVFIRLGQLQFQRATLSYRRWQVNASSGLPLHGNQRKKWY